MNFYKYLSKSGWIKQQVIKTKLTTKNINVPIIVWDKNLFGSCMKYTWIEEDLCGDSMEININVSTKYDNGTNLSGTAKINISKNDDLAGESLVFYTDKTTGDGTWYNTGIVKFNIIQE